MKPVRFLSLLILLLLLPASSSAQKEAPPPGGTPKSFRLPEKKVFTLQNGLRVTLVPYGRIPKASLELVTRTGNIHEAEDEVWLADLVGDYLKEGTELLTAQDLARESATLGGTLEVGVGADETTISIDVLSEHAPRGVTLLADVAAHPRFPETELERLRANMLRILGIQKTQPESIALEKFRSVLYSDHPYGRVFPTEEMIRSYTVEKVRGFFDRNFGAGRSDLYVVGRFAEEETEEAIRRAFEPWVRGPESVTNPPRPQTTREIHLVGRPGAAQSNLMIGLPVPDPSDPDYVPLVVMNTLLGGSFASRITTNIREDKGYTYSPSSSISSRYRDAYWVQNANVATDVTGPAIKEILFEIDRLQREAPSQEELEGIQNYRAGIFVLQNSSRTGIIGQLAFIRLHGLDDSFLTDYVKRVYAVTPEEVSELAKKYIRTEDLAFVVVGDKESILDQVKPFGTVSD